MLNSRFLISIALAAAAAASLPALAHDDATLDKMVTPHGGQLRMAGPYHFELVVTPGADGSQATPIQVYVTDHAGSKAAVAGAKGSAVVLAGGSKASIALQPDGENRLSGLGSYRAGADMKVVVSITLAGKATQSARFTPLAKEAPAAHAGKH